VQYNANAPDDLPVGGDWGNSHSEVTESTEKTLNVNPGKLSVAFASIVAVAGGRPVDSRDPSLIVEGMDDAALIQSFENGVVPPGGFHHAQHVRVAWCYLRQHPLLEALDRFQTRLRAFAVAQDKPDLYHETITTAYVLLINERLSEDGAGDGDWEAFAARNADLLTWKPSILERYYRTETLWSERARRTFVMPDRLDGAVESSWPPSPMT
jgi:hypothetical protein